MKYKNTLKIIAEITIMSALAFTLDYAQGLITGGLFPNGGSIGIAMLPILFLSYRRGFLSGLICGLVVSVLQMIPGIYVIPGANLPTIIFQVLLDYVIAYPLIGFSGLFFKSFTKTNKNSIKITFLISGTLLGGMLKFLTHFLAGVIFWSSSCPDRFVGGPIVYSFLYNGSYMFPNIIICGLIITLMYLKIPKLFNNTDN